MKKVPFFPNKSDNLHCLQSCVESVLNYFKVQYTTDNIDKKIGFFGTMPWLPHCVNWFNDLGLSVKLMSPFDYNQLVVNGEQYLKSFKGDVFFKKEKEQGQYDHLDEVKIAAKSMIENKLWEKKRMSISELAAFLCNEKNIAISKTLYEYLSGNEKPETLTPHFVTVIKQYSAGKWLIHDPGLPPMSGRKVEQVIGNGVEILGDVVIISKAV